MTVRIDHLEVQFDVDGEGDEAVFARLFDRYMRRLQTDQTHARRILAIAERNRRLVDDDEEED